MWERLWKWLMQRHGERGYLFLATLIERYWIKYHVESFFVNLDDALEAIKKDAQAPPDRKLFSYYD
ncbi:MAG TPA: hypothetical protein PK033_13770 [Acetivibrio sp.]|nr:hypothetical protein [Acetivibrio sp.]